MHPILYFSVFSQPTKQQFQERLSYVKQSRDVQKSQSHLESLVEGIAAIPLSQTLWVQKFLLPEGPIV